MSELPHYLQDKRALIETRLEELLGPSAGCPPALLEAMRYSVLGAGKRLRPILVVLAAEACGGKCMDALTAGSAVEMIHAYSLVHDDLPAMDDDDLRRGQPTCHKKFGEAMAILAGDALLTLAFQVLVEGYSPPVAAACCRELAHGAGAAGMVGGQVEDLAWEKGGGVFEDLEQIHARKTGALFRSCLRLGVIVAEGERPTGADPEHLHSLDAFGRCFGQVFQITDDLLDVEGTSDQTGKRVGKDAARGKLTYPGFLGVAESRRRADHLSQEALDHLRSFGNNGDRLAALMRMILNRDR